MTASERFPAGEVAFVVGTRPEIVKTAPVVRAVTATDGLEPYLVHTDQHYDAALSDAFFDALDLPAPDRHLGVGSGTQAQQVARGLAAVEAVLEERKPLVVLAQGDTNAVLSTALAAAKLDVPFGHVEAGLRSWDRSMPEEVNRVLADHVADFAFAPTETAAANLAAEGIVDGVRVTGNTVVDACLDHCDVARRESDALDRFGLDAGAYALATVHRPVNADDPGRLREILAALDDQPFPVVLPAHPRTRAAADGLDFEPAGALRLVDPLGYLDFLRLLDETRVVVTDSGGVQEEASVLSTPCLTVRPNTERPETVEAGVNELVEPPALGARLGGLYADDAALDRMSGRTDLYGDGDAGERIAATLGEAL